MSAGADPHVDVHDRRPPGRRPWGCAAVLLPHDDRGRVDWGSFRGLLERTAAAGLTPAVNMDTGFVQLLDDPTRQRVLTTAAEVLADRPTPPGRARFLAGAVVDDGPGAPLDLGRYLDAVDAVQGAGGTPVVFPSHGLNALDPDG